MIRQTPATSVADSSTLDEPFTRNSGGRNPVADDNGTDLPTGASNRATSAEVADAAPRARSKVRRKRAARWVGFASILLSVTAGAFVYLRARPVDPTYRTAEVVRGDIVERVSATGTLQPVVMSPVGAQVSGIVWKLHADFNSHVQAGDALVELDPSLFKNAVGQAEAQVATAVAAVANAEAAQEGAQIANDRTLRLAKDALASTQDVDAARTVLKQAIAQEGAATAQLQNARVQLLRARLDLEHSIIRSPVTGTVISRNVDVGQAVASTLTAPTLFTIAQDLRHMQVHAAVDEADVGGVRAGQAASFTVDAFRKDTFQAVVHEVRNAPQTAQNVVTYDVVLDVDNPDERLRPGMTANLQILVAQKLQVVAVPNDALRFRPEDTSSPGPGGAAHPTSALTAHGAAAVYVPNGVRAVRTPVTTGATDGTVTEVEGLAPGQQVIVDTIRAKTNKSRGAGGGAGRV